MFARTSRWLGRTSLTAALLPAVAMAGAGAASAADLAPVVVVPMVVVPPPAPSPSAYASVALLYMTRSTPQQTPIFYYETPRAEPLPGATRFGDILDASDFDFGRSFGIAGRAGVVLPSGTVAFEAGGFWLAPMTASHGNDAGPGTVMATVPNQTNVWNVLAFEARNTTRVRGFDANAVARLGSGVVAVYAGLARIVVHDEMVIDPVMAGAPELWTWTTDNRMTGPQIGARATIGSGAVSVEIGGRMGALYNRISNAVLFDRVGDFDLVGNDAGTVWSLMAAGSVTARMNLTPNFAITAGYEALWLQRVAQAPHQVMGTYPPVSADPEVISLSTTYAPLLIHGFTAGVSLRF